VPANWKDTYRKALLEKDPKRLVDAIRLAESAIQARLQELATSSDVGNGIERADLNTALRDLIALKAEYRLP
jgi:hypothetical protein